MNLLLGRSNGNTQTDQHGDVWRDWVGLRSCKCACSCSGCRGVPCMSNRRAGLVCPAHYEAHACLNLVLTLHHEEHCEQPVGECARALALQCRRGGSTAPE